MAGKSMGGGGGASAPSVAPTSAPATGGGGSMPGGASKDGAMAQAQSQVRSQAPQAGQTLNAAQSQAANSPQHRVGASETNPGRAQDKAGTPAADTQKAGQTMQNAGVTTNAQQSPETKAQMQSALDNAGKNGQNGPQQEGSRTAAVRDEAKNSATPKEAPSSSMEK